MNDTLRKTFEEQLTYLPAVNQQALRSFDWATELVGIGKQFGLHIDQLEDLQIETMLVLVGVVSAEDYENELITRLAVSPSEAEKIIEQVNEKIFVPIHDYIVRGGPDTPAPTSAEIMQSAGFSFTAPEPVVTEPVAQPITFQSQTPLPTPEPSNPLQFNPGSPVLDVPIPETIIPTNTTQIPSPKEKLEKLYQERKKVIDMTIQSMDQEKI